ncbi:putative short chain oxidoreductase protein [Mycolicibacterium conceptionense]|uniref:Putative short chain oxidoreductase protein n=1 Tax=Mycolicibacterium conceptionense TaxID=451644 RepID=A0A0U1DJJ0_9MYCO|nr:hypothetical protein [Mycolicibacterium conceptionense]ORV24661.1 hypothetical protein AWB98_20700 [Mycolicibacterium conceptionense]CQD16674.1 putative short chain oxidoreductase protein [Mycolicibacterium conceptionense]
MSNDKTMAHAIATQVSRRTVLYGSAALAALALSGPASATPPGTTVLITGTSSGFSRLIAEGYARYGAKVAATMRDINGRNATAAAELRALAHSNNLDLEVIDIDVLKPGLDRCRSVTSNEPLRSDRCTGQ